MMTQRRFSWVALISSLIAGVASPLIRASDLSMKVLSDPVLVDRPVAFEAKTDAGIVADIQWDFGDGHVAVGKHVQHTFQQPGIYPVRISTKEERPRKRLVAIIRARTPDRNPIPKVLLDTDARCEADDQHFISYALFRGLDVLGVNSVHNGAGTESINYGEIHYVFRLSRSIGFPKDRVPNAYHGADHKLAIPDSGQWTDTQPIVTEASDAILAAARGASPGNPALVLAVGAGTNVASAILDAQREGLDLQERIRVIWLGGHAKNYHKEHNGDKDPWSVYIMGQSGIDLQILLSHPTSLKLHIDKRVESALYPDNELGKYLLQITPVHQWKSTRPKALHDACVLAVVINEYLGLDWIKEVEPTYVSGPEKDYSWQQVDGDSTVRLIRDIDGEAMKNDLFETLNGRATPLQPFTGQRNDEPRMNTNEHE